jgi:hypothetical protein
LFYVYTTPVSYPSDTIADNAADAVAQEHSELVLRDERALDSPPANPADCTLEAPVRSVTVGDGPISFVTAVAGARALLAVSTVTGSIAWVSGSDQAIHTFESIAYPRTALFAGGAHDTLLLAWSVAVNAADNRRSARLAVWTEAAPTRQDTLVARVFSLPVQFERTVVDVACERAAQPHARCVIATNWREEYTPRDDLRAQWLELDPSELTRLRSVVIAHGLTAQSALSRSAIVGTAVSEGATQLVLTDATHSIERAVPTVLDRLVHDERLFRLSAAPSNVLDAGASRERCQPGAWAVRITQVPANSHTNEEVEVASTRTDAQPRGGRVRWTGAHDEAHTHESAAAFWLDAPQCAEQLLVIRSLRKGQAVTLASAREFDVAADRALLSLAWRSGGQLRWARYRCF